MAEQDFEIALLEGLTAAASTGARRSLQVRGVQGGGRGLGALRALRMPFVGRTRMVSMRAFHLTLTLPLPPHQAGLVLATSPHLGLQLGRERVTPTPPLLADT